MNETKAVSPNEGSPYVAYSYSYPHKTAYRPLQLERPLTEVWAGEDKSSLFLYVHIPFCEHRCGFCNLFTEANPADGLTRRYLDQLRNEASIVAAALGSQARFARLAIGGGTPTFLDVEELQDLIETVVKLGAEPVSIPTGIEVSPATVDSEKLSLLKEWGADRISIGVQSFDDHEANRIGRPQKRGDVERALAAIRDQKFSVLNIDLIYGGDQQTLDQWLVNVREAIKWRAEEIYLYPLYVRPLTRLSRWSGNRDTEWDNQRLAAYRAAREELLNRGYEQVSMRMFRRTDVLETAGPVYCCQSDGMVGLGCGARSYTQNLHYSTEYAVGQKGVHSILLDYLNRDANAFRAARYGFELNVDEQQRRFLIQSLLQTVGLSRMDWKQRFGLDVLAVFPWLEKLSEWKLANMQDDTITLTSLGMERSDAIGPWLYSQCVQELSQQYEMV